jgi:hypothetical protein
VAKREAPRSPMAHIRGHMRGYLGCNLCADSEPSGTPASPDIMAVMPNLYATLQTMLLHHHHRHIFEIISACISVYH